VHYNLAVTYEDLLDNPAGARRHYEQVIALYDARKEATGEHDRYWAEELESHLSLGGLYLEQGAVDLAGRHFGAVLQSGTGEAALAGPAALGLARCMLARGDVDGAERLLDQAVEAFPELATQAEALLGPMRRAAAGS
jgi:tetratricopeptide (TPR) repeat protein